MLLFCLIGFFGIVIAGTVGHFVYHWLNRSQWIAWAVPINESTWEHLKLVAMPMIVWYLIGLLTVNFNNYDLGIFSAMVVSCVLILVIFYTYIAFTKKPILAIDVASFVVAVTVGCLTAFNIFRNQPLPVFLNWISKLGILITFIMFVVFTYFPPKCFLFEDPTTKTYGYKEHKKSI